MRDRAKHIADCREYRKTHPDKRYGTPQYNAIQLARMRARRADPRRYVEEVARQRMKRRLTAIEQMRKELAVVA